MPRLSLLLLALFSGLPALLYEVVWTREAALVAGSQIEGISLVLAAFFGGLALGAAVFGPVADRVRSPLRLYAALEAGAAVLAIASPAWLRALGATVTIAPSAKGIVTAISLLPITLLLGGTLPALLRAAHRGEGSPAGRAGWLVGANTAGSVAGVASAVLAIPAIGLALTTRFAGGIALLLALVAWALAPRFALAPGASPPRPESPAIPRRLLLAAAVAGVATLAFEVLAARLATLRLGSSLHAWGIVLGLVLAGLALGNALGARRAHRSSRPATDLGWIECGAALAIIAGLHALEPTLARPAAGLTWAGLRDVALGSFPPALLMGAAFPFLVRLSVGPARVGAGFGRVSAANTLGGVAGSVLAPFVLLPAFGFPGSVLVCAALGIGLALAFQWGHPRAQLATALLGVLAVLTLPRPPAQLPSGERVLFVEHDRQATVAVVRTPARRDLLVDGDPEASTAGTARETEEWLALLPLAIHPKAERLLEVGLGAGVTLGMAATFPLHDIACVEIAPSVLAAARYFVPANRAVASGADPRVRIRVADGRAHLARHVSHYDVVLANTLHPWSVGATGLYSREYFARLAASLREGGIAAQWVPIERIGAESLEAILRTFFDVFPEGDLFWGANNLILLGSLASMPLPGDERFTALPPAARSRLRAYGVESAADLAARRIARASSVRTATASVRPLVDDVPRLEALANRRGPGRGRELASVARIAGLGAEGGGGSLPMRHFLEAQAAFAAGDVAGGERLERLASDAGSVFARRKTAARKAGEGRRHFARGDFAAARSAFERALTHWKAEPTALFGLAALAHARSDRSAASGFLERLVALHGDHAEAWNLLGALRQEKGDLRSASQAYEAALESDPFFPEALANAALLAHGRGDLEHARRTLARLEALGPSARTESSAVRTALNGPR